MTETPIHVFEPELTRPTPRAVEADAAARNERVITANLLVGALLVAYFFVSAQSPEVRLLAVPPLLLAAVTATYGAGRELFWRWQRLLLAYGKPVTGIIEKRKRSVEQPGHSRVTYRFPLGHWQERAEFLANNEWLDAHGFTEGAPITVLLNPRQSFCTFRAYCDLSGVRIEGRPERWTRGPVGTEVRS
jgi:hypothetical protein